MIVEILYFAEIKDITGKEREKFEVSQNMGDLLHVLFEKYKSLHDLIWNEESQKINNLISVIINNQAIHQIDPSQIHLNNGDTIAFLLPVSGG